MDILSHLCLVVIAIFVCRLTSVPLAESKRVLFMPYFQTSHVLQYVKVAEAVADLGHEVYVFMPYAVYITRFSKLPKRINILTYGEDVDPVDKVFQNYTNNLHNFWHEAMDRFDLVAFMKGHDITTTVNRKILTNVTLMDIVRDIKADLFVLDSLPYCRNLLLIPYKFDIPFIILGPHFDHISSRIPISPSSTPMILFRDPFSGHISFWQRLKLTVFHVLSYLYDPFWDSHIVPAAVPEKPYVSSWDLTAKAEMYLFETDHILDFPRPLLPNTKMIGGMSPLPAKPLRGDLKSFVEGSPNGIIYVAFGTQGENIPEHIVSKMAKAFQKVPLKIVWRASITTPNSAQIMTTLWVPQNDLLGHNKTKLFVSHCGSWSQYESLYHAVPLLCLPLFADQFYNANRATFRGFGQQADIRKVKAEELARLMLQVATNSSYAQTVHQASHLFRLHYRLPVKEAAYWLDHVMVYGGSYMRAPGQEMPLYQFLCVDMAISAFTISLAGMFAIYILIKRLPAYFWPADKRKRD